MAALAMTLLALAVDLQHQGPEFDGRLILRPLLSPFGLEWATSGTAQGNVWFTRVYFSVTAVRIVVPVFGLLSLVVSLMVIVPFAYTVVRKLNEYPKYEMYHHEEEGEQPGDSDAGQSGRRGPS